MCRDSGKKGRDEWSPFVGVCECLACPQQYSAELLLELSMLGPGTVSIFDLSGRLSRAQPAAAAATCGSIMGDAFQLYS